MQYSNAQINAIIRPMIEAYATELGGIRLGERSSSGDPRDLVSANDYNIGADRCLVFAKNAFREGLFEDWKPNQWEAAGIILCRRDSGMHDDEFRDAAEKWGFAQKNAATADSFLNRFLTRCPLQAGSREILFTRNENFEPMTPEDDPKEDVSETLSPASPDNFLSVLKGMRSRKAIPAETYERLAFDLRNGYSRARSAYARNGETAARAQEEIREMLDAENRDAEKSCQRAARRAESHPC